MLMDLFHESCAVEKKQRIHFHQFMLDVHNSKQISAVETFINAMKISIRIIAQIIKHKLMF